jgi:hypothetical protein
VKVVSLLRFSNVDLQKNTPHKKEKNNDILLHQNIKYSGMEISRGPVAQGPYKFGWATRN